MRDGSANSADAAQLERERPSFGVALHWLMPEFGSTVGDQRHRQLFINIGVPFDVEPANGMPDTLETRPRVRQASEHLHNLDRRARRPHRK